MTVTEAEELLKKRFVLMKVKLQNCKDRPKKNKKIELLINLIFLVFVLF